MKNIPLSGKTLSPLFSTGIALNSDFLSKFLTESIFYCHGHFPQVFTLIYHKFRKQTLKKINDTIKNLFIRAHKKDSDMA